MALTTKHGAPQVPGFEHAGTLSNFGGVIRRFHWSPNGQSLMVVSQASDLVLCDREDRSRRALEVSPHMIFSIEWSRDGDSLACGTEAGFVILWDVDSGRITRIMSGHSGAIFSVGWSPDGRLASGDSEGKILLRDPKAMDSGRSLPGHLPGHAGVITSLRWSPDGRRLASGSTDHTLKIWDVESGRVVREIKTSSQILKLAWSPDGSIITSSLNDCALVVWDTATARLIAYLEGPTAITNDLSFSFDGRLLASRSVDGDVRIWRCDQWVRIVKFNLGSSHIKPPGLHFHPSELTLATLGEKDQSVEIWKLDQRLLAGTVPAASPAHYSNAKIVLVGEQGVGKSGLSLVLVGQSFQPTSSTHGRKVLLLESREVVRRDGGRELQETFLWDLAGQPDYRLTHQLHLIEVAVALIVFDAQNESAIFAGVHYWVRALRQARQLAGEGAPQLKVLLVSARVDRGGIPVAGSRIEALVAELGLDGHYETSAQEGWGIPELRDAIRAGIDWSSLPKVSSPRLFHEIKSFLFEEQGRRRLVSTIEDLYSAFLRTQGSAPVSPHLRAQFETCVGLAASRGVIQLLSFGHLVLLQPELLDFYSSALINAARSEPDGLGSISEADARSGRFRMPSQGRIQDMEQEKLVLLATIEDLLRHELVLLEAADTGTYLVFPSQFTREAPDAPAAYREDLVFEFEGPTLNIYASLAVRLSHSGFFTSQEMWKNGSSYVGRLGGTCGICFREVAEARGQLLLSFDPSTSPETSYLFEEYVYVHLSRRAAPGSVRRRRIFSCPACRVPATDLAVARRRELGFDWMRCNVCEERFSIQDRDSTGAGMRVPIPEMDRAADARRAQDVAALVLQGKIATTDFDVFFAYNTEDRKLVEAVAEELKRRGINPWFDRERLSPGELLMSSIQRAIDEAKAAAVFIGTMGVGRWQAMEVRLLLERSVSGPIKIIPVLLPGVREIPGALAFLKQFSNVSFESKMNEADALDALEWGITGLYPKGSAALM